MTVLIHLVVSSGDFEIATGNFDRSNFV